MPYTVHILSTHLLYQKSNLHWKYKYTQQIKASVVTDVDIKLIVAILVPTTVEETLGPDTFLLTTCSQVPYVKKPNQNDQPLREHRR